MGSGSSKNEKDPNVLSSAEAASVAARLTQGDTGDEGVVSGGAFDDFFEEEDRDDRDRAVGAAEESASPYGGGRASDGGVANSDASMDVSSRHRSPGMGSVGSGTRDSHSTLDAAHMGPSKLRSAEPSTPSTAGPAAAAAAAAAIEAAADSDSDALRNSAQGASRGERGDAPSSASVRACVPPASATLGAGDGVARAAAELATERALHRAHARRLRARARDCGAGARRTLTEMRRFASAPVPADVGGDEPIQNPLLLTGVAGSGKSTMLARLACALEDEVKRHGGYSRSGGYDGLPVLYHFVDAPGACRDARAVAERLCHELRAHFGGRAATGRYGLAGALLREVPASPGALPSALSRMLMHAASCGGCVIVLDGLDKLDVGVGARISLDWLPRSLPHCVRVVLSGAGGVWCEAARRRYGGAVLESEMPTLVRSEAVSLARELLAARFRSGVSDSEASALVRAAVSDQDYDEIEAGAPVPSVTPGFLAAAADEVVATAESELPDDILSAIEAVEASELMVYDQALSRLEEAHGDGVVADAMCAYAACDCGLAPSEMLAFLRSREGTEALTAVHWEKILQTMHPLLTITSATGAGGGDGAGYVRSDDLALERAFLGGAACARNALVRRAVEERYLQESSFKKRDVHEALAAHLCSVPPKADASALRLCRETLYHLRQARRWNDLRACLVHPACTLHFGGSRLHRYSLLEGWAACVQQCAGGRGALVADVEEATTAAVEAAAMAEAAVARGAIPSSHTDGSVRMRASEAEQSCAALACFLDFLGRPGEAAGVYARAADRRARASSGANSALSSVGAHAVARLQISCAKSLLAAASLAPIGAGVDAQSGGNAAASEAEGVLKEALRVAMGIAREAPVLALDALAHLGAAMERLNRLGDAEEAYSRLNVELEGVADGDGERIGDTLDVGVDGSDWARLALARSFCSLSRVLDARDRHADAQTALEQALRSLEATLGAAHPEVSSHLADMATCYKGHGEWQKAEFCLARTLESARALYGHSSLPVARVHTSLAELQRVQGNLPAAEELYSRALKIAERVLGSDHLEVATYINNVAEVARVQGRHDVAEPLYKRALAVDEAVHGHESPTLAIRLSNLGEFYRDMGRLAEAEPLYRRALALDEAALGPDHPNVATYLNNLAGVKKAQGELNEALELYRRALAIDEAALGPDHPDVAIYYNNMAGLYRLRGDHSQALTLYDRALAINTALLGDDHTDVAIYYNNAALCLRDLDRCDEAEGYFVRAISIGERSLGAQHPTVAARLVNMGSMALLSQSKPQLAEVLFERALAIYESIGKGASDDAEACREWLRSVGDTIAIDCEDVMEDMLDRLEDDFAVRAVPDNSAQLRQAASHEERTKAARAARQEYGDRRLLELGRKQLSAGLPPAVNPPALTPHTPLEVNVPTEAVLEAARALHSPQLEALSAQLGAFLRNQEEILEAQRAQAEQQLLLERQRQQLLVQAQQQQLLTQQQTQEMLTRRVAAAGVEVDKADEASARGAERAESPVPQPQAAAPGADAGAGLVARPSSSPADAIEAAVSAQTAATEQQLAQMASLTELLRSQQDIQREMAAALARQVEAQLEALKSAETTPEREHGPRTITVYAGAEGGASAPGPEPKVQQLPAVSVTEEMVVEFMSSRVELVRPRCYRCSLTGKELSSYSLMKTYYQREPRVLAQVARWAVATGRHVNSPDANDAVPLGVLRSSTPGAHTRAHARTHADAQAHAQCADPPLADEEVQRSAHTGAPVPLPLMPADPLRQPYAPAETRVTPDFKTLLNKERALYSLAQDLRGQTHADLDNVRLDSARGAKHGVHFSGSPAKASDEHVSDALLDVFMATRVEPRADGRYVDTLTGKVLSTYNLMRTFYRRRHMGELRSWLAARRAAEAQLDRSLKGAA